MEDSWELVAVPAEIENSTVGKETSPDAPETPLEKNEGHIKPKVCNLTGNSLRRFYASSKNELVRLTLVLRPIFLSKMSLT